MGKRLWMMLAVCLSAISMTFAQKTVTGRVFDQSTGEAIVGASVIVTGANIGAATNMDGDFTIHNVPANAKTLKISYMGMKTTEVAIKSKIRVYLEPQQTEMDEVLVVAYGTQKRSAYTGAASEIKAEQIDNRQFGNVTQALVGTMAGVQTIQSSGAPGSGVAVRVRGISSMNGDLAPLYVLDGVPYDGDITALNPSDIESITVLKDAVSTALYGSRGANGVVMITTKKGKLGEAKITFDAKWGATSREIKNYDVIKDPAQYLELIYSGFYNEYAGTYSAAEANRLANDRIYSNILGGGYSNIYTLPTGQNLIGLDGKLNPNATLGGTDGTYYYRPDDWEKETFKTGFRQEYNVSLSAADERLNYYASFGYLDDKGIIEGSEFKRFSGRVNIDYQAKDWLKIGTQTSFGHMIINSANDNGAEGGSLNAFYVANRLAPVFPMYVRDAQGNRVFNELYGHYVYDYGDGQSSNGKRAFMALSNPASDLLYNYDENVADVLNTNWYALFDFGHGFTASAKVGLNVDNTHWAGTTNPIYGQGASHGGEVSQTYSNSTALTHQYLVNYINTFGLHSVNATAGFEGYRYKSEGFNAVGQNMYNPFNPTLSNVIDQFRAAGSKSSFNTAGFFFTGNYVYDQRYYVNLGFRRDGTSVFAKKNRWGNFGSIGLGWNMKNESWLKDFEPLDLLKFRASFGQVGNDNHGTMLYAYTDIYRVTGSNGVFSDGTIAQKGNPDLKWEKTNSWNVGFDYSFFKGRLTGSIEYFIRQTSNMLDYRRIASSNGYSSIPVNFGSVRNNGIDFEVSYDIFRNKDFEWNVSLNFTSYKNKIVELSPEYNGEYIAGSRIYREGGSIYNLYLVQWAGVDPETGLAQYWTNNNYYYDMEGNAITAADIEEGGLVEGTDYTKETKYERTTNWNSAYANARKESGSTLPDVYGGFGTTLKWKGFDLYVQTSWQWGGKMVDSDYQEFMNTYNNFDGRTFHKNILNAWTPENRDTNVPRVNPNDLYPAATSTNFLIKSDYFSIDNITLGYTFPKSVTLPLGIEALRVFGSAENVCIFSARKGLDPRMSLISSAASNYSARRIISGGIKLTF